MRQGASGIGAALIVALVVLASCNRAPAEEALAVAEEAVAAARVGLIDEDLVAFDRALEEARAALDEGRYTDALRITQNLPARVRLARDRAATRRHAAAPEPRLEPEPETQAVETTPTPAPDESGAPEATADGS